MGMKNNLIHPLDISRCIMYDWVGSDESLKRGGHKMELMTETIEGMMGTGFDDRTRHDVVWLVVYAFGRPEVRN